MARDIAPAVSPDEQTIDVEGAVPYLEELIRAQRERDDALGRAEFAEALAAERERLLRLASVPVPNERHAPVPGLDSEGQSVLDVLYASHHETPSPNAAAAAPKPARKKPAARRKASAPRNGAAEPAPTDVVYLAPRPTADQVTADGPGGRQTLNALPAAVDVDHRIADEA